VTEARADRHADRQTDRQTDTDTQTETNKKTDRTDQPDRTDRTGCTNRTDSAQRADMTGQTGVTARQQNTQAKQDRTEQDRTGPPCGRAGAGRQAGRQADTQIDRQEKRQTTTRSWPGEGRTRQVKTGQGQDRTGRADRTDGRTDGRTDRQAGRQTGRHTDNRVEQPSKHTSTQARKRTQCPRVRPRSARGLSAGRWPSAGPEPGGTGPRCAAPRCAHGLVAGRVWQGVLDARPRSIGSLGPAPRVPAGLQAGLARLPTQAHASDPATPLACMSETAALPREQLEDPQERFFLVVLDVHRVGEERQVPDNVPEHVEFRRGGPQQQASLGGLRGQPLIGVQKALTPLRRRSYILRVHTPPRAPQDLQKRAQRVEAHRTDDAVGVVLAALDGLCMGGRGRAEVCAESAVAGGDYEVGERRQSVCASQVWHTGVRVSDSSACVSALCHDTRVVTCPHTCQRRVTTHARRPRAAVRVLRCHTLPWRRSTDGMAVGYEDLTLS
jgi:hypothetical protein